MKKIRKELVNMRAINNFFQEPRRDINILERPLVGARGTGKTYIYSNYNPICPYVDNNI